MALTGWLAGRSAAEWCCELAGISDRAQPAGVVVVLAGAEPETGRARQSSTGP